MFPFLNRKMDFSHEHEQHEAVHAFLSDFLAVVRAAKADAATFDAAQLKAKMLGSHDAIVRILRLFTCTAQLTMFSHAVHALQ